MFVKQEIYNNYRYSVYVTNLTFASAEIWRFYHGRANAENRFKELKYDFGFDSFNLQSFFGTEAALTFAMIFYNLMALFKNICTTRKSSKNTINTKI